MLRNGAPMVVLVHMERVKHRIFNGEELANQRLKESFIKSFFDLSKVQLEMGNFSIMTFIHSLSCR